MDCQNPLTHLSRLLRMSPYRLSQLLLNIRICSNCTLHFSHDDYQHLQQVYWSFVVEKTLRGKNLNCNFGLQNFDQVPIQWVALRYYMTDCSNLLITRRIVYLKWKHCQHTFLTIDTSITVSLMSLLQKDIFTKLKTYLDRLKHQSFACLL